jgi:hypothetical protein
LEILRAADAIFVKWTFTMNWLTIPVLAIAIAAAIVVVRPSA